MMHWGNQRENIIPMSVPNVTRSNEAAFNTNPTPCIKWLKSTHRNNVTIAKGAVNLNIVAVNVVCCKL